jgi:hypothetical protein
MNLNEQITEILKDNVAQMTMGMNEKKEIWAVALQLVETGASSQMEIKHNANGSSVVECVTLLKKQIDHSNQIRSLVLTRKIK